MVESASQTGSSVIGRLTERLLPVLVKIYLAVVLICFVCAPIFYLSSLGGPFIGAFIQHSLMVSTAKPTQVDGWNLRSQLEDEFGYQLISIDGEKLDHYFDIQRNLNQFSVGEQVGLGMREPGGEQRDYAVDLQPLPLLDQLVYFWIPFVSGLIFLGCGLYVYWVRRGDAIGRAFALFSVSGGLVVAGIYDLGRTNYQTVFWTFSLAIAGAALFELALIYPEKHRQVKKRPYLSWLAYIPAVGLALLALSTLYNIDNPSLNLLAWRFEFLFLGLAGVYLLVMTLGHYYSDASPSVRELARVISWGALVAFGSVLAWILVINIFPEFGFGALFTLPLAIFPLVYGFTIVRNSMVTGDYLISRLATYAILSIMVVGGFALIISGLSLVFGDLFGLNSPIIVGLVVLVLVLAFNPARRALQRSIDRAFGRGQLIDQERLEAFSQGLTQAVNPQQIVSLVHSFVDESLEPTGFHAFIYDPLSSGYQDVGYDESRSGSEVRFPANSEFVKILSEQAGGIFPANHKSILKLPQEDQARLAILNPEVIMPLPGRQQLVGWLMLGVRSSGEAYKTQNLEYLKALCTQAAMALERAEVVADLEGRVREMNVLTRVAQGVSFTIAFDDILELIYAQTNQVLPTNDFRITLLDEEAEALYHAFYLENDERLGGQENKFIPTDQGLESEVISNQHALLTDDYDRECRDRGILPTMSNVYAWMGVPLNAGAKTIGSVSAGSRDPAIRYNDDQRNLLQAIADQAAGAIVKARLLQETENRAHQLATLNEISVGLTSNLELRPLLRQILESATEILECEAGSLFLIDDDTNELIFEVVIGPVAGDLVGRRLPAGSGLVGQAVDSGKAIIANDAKRRKQWFEGADQQTGFDTQDLLVVPMRVQDQVIGVIEVINKIDGAPFTKEDQELLTAFTGQATIAMENARLYTMTDQALAERVEELSVMQRIDRELNASLEIDRAMRITLDWAMRQSKAEAGLVGTVEPEGVRVMTAQGYTHELDGYWSTGSENGSYRLLSIADTGVGQALQTGQPQCLIVDGSTSEGQFGLLDETQLQIVVPIQRETTSIGLILLESSQAKTYTAELIEFLTRLADHAAIAIANAQLYEEVTEANLAKSRFVSFVAHELKNPMASIKGYTELVSGGVAGPVNDMQLGFLDTVRSNVDRMNTIVSDLNDLTKIQVGNLRLEYHTLQIEDTLDEVTRSLKRQIDEKEQDLVIELPDDLPTVWADPSRLAQIFTNLMSNATKYTPQGGQIFIGAQQMSESDERAGTELVHVWVKDTGVGISEDDQSGIFQQYFRTDTAKEMAAGTGLGLSITKSLVEMQGGRIWFESTVDVGTTFHITIPLAETQ